MEEAYNNSCIFFPFNSKFKLKIQTYLEIQYINLEIQYFNH